MSGLGREAVKKEKAAAAPTPPPKKTSLPKPTPPPAPPEPEPMSADARSRAIDRVGAYRERFPWLKKRTASITAKISDDELLDEIHFIEMQLGSKNQDSSFGLTLFTSAMSGLEMSTKVYNPLGLQLDGLSQVARDNSDQFKDVIDELLVKYTTGVYLSPETRLVMSVGALVMTVHAANSGDPRIKEALSRVGSTVKAPNGTEDL
jgi:hypothetical protein